MEATARRRRGVGTAVDAGCIESCLRQRNIRSNWTRWLSQARVHAPRFKHGQSQGSDSVTLPELSLEPSCSYPHTLTLDAGRWFPCRHFTCGHHTSVLHFVLGQIPCITHWPCISCHSLEQRGFQCMDSNWRVTCLSLPLHPH